MNNQIRVDRGADVTIREPEASGLIFRAVEFPPHTQNAQKRTTILREVNTAGSRGTHRPSRSPTQTIQTYYGTLAPRNVCAPRSIQAGLHPPEWLRRPIGSRRWPAGWTVTPSDGRGGGRTLFQLSCITTWLRRIAALGGPDTDGGRAAARVTSAGVDASPEPPPPSTPSPAPGATRDLLANERTLLAWARTAIAIMGLGFVVARFGYVIRVLAGVGGTGPRGVSTAFGVVLVLCGVLLLSLAHVRYLRLAEDIIHSRVSWDSRLGVVLTSLLVLTGLLLAAYLLLSS